MSIVRLPRRARFSIISAECIEDKRLSWESRGLLIYLLSKQDSWVVQIKDLINQTKQCIGVRSGRDKVYKLLKELRCAGYLWRDYARTGGTFSGVEYVVSEEPDLEAGAEYMRELEAKALAKGKGPFPDLPETVTPATESAFTAQPFTGKPETIDKTERAISIEKASKNFTAEVSADDSSLAAVEAKATAHSPAPGEPDSYPQDPQAKTYGAWHAYARAYKIRYQSWPLCNKTVLSKIGQVVDRVGELAPLVATYFVTHDESTYAKSGCHPVGLLLSNCEGYATRAQQAERVKKLTEQSKRSAPVATAEPATAPQPAAPKSEAALAGKAALDALMPRRRGMNRVGAVA